MASQQDRNKGWSKFLLFTVSYILIPSYKYETGSANNIHYTVICAFKNIQKNDKD